MNLSLAPDANCRDVSAALNLPPTDAASALARARMLTRSGEPFLVGDWDRALMLHYEVDPEALRKQVPYPLDLRDGRAYVSLVAFRLRRMRPRIGGRIAAWLFSPIATHDFLNVRTYVETGGESGIHFLAEYLNNRLSVRLGPAIYGLPYRYARIDYRHDWRTGALSGRVTDPAIGTALSYRGLIDAESEFVRTGPGSLTEWLMERYSAFNAAGNRLRFFRVWHPGWRQVPALVRTLDDSLLRERWPWFAGARYAGANFSPGLRNVWMGRPHRIGEA